ncbi:HAMP domain-containing methyl-accepting chemotaxis protein [Thioflexithrix psekupsensis]|uniref:HAMP domain-containing methyl-accepting chemotaxis protein n=1 Tax=Thioflexithrix psekupsensis TaxID=1570016 RepID=UPI002477F359|nr:methyl-accepting chemotaxis protein [Thioflexithrix psekupsensis]
MEKTWLPAVIAINAANTGTSDLHTALFRFIAATDSNEAMKQEKAIQTQRNFIAEQLGKYEPTVDTEEERVIQQEFSKLYNEYLTAVEKVILLAEQKAKKTSTTTDAQENATMATQLERALDRADVLFNDMSINLLKLVDFNNAGAREASHEGDSIYELSFSMLVGTSACVFVLAILLMIWFEKIVSSPLNRLTAIVRQVADGNVVITKEYYDRYDEVGYIAKAIGDITQILNALIKDSSELISAAQQGALSTRVDATRHPGEFGTLIVGMNQLLDVLSKPLTEVAEVMQQLALGNLNKRIDGAYEGDLRALKANVNRSLDSLITLLTELGEVTKNMSVGDLTHHVEGSYQGEFASLKTNTNQSLKQMKEILTVVVSNTEHIASASVQTLAAAEHVSSQSSQQMAALDEVATAVVQSSAAIGQVAENTTKSGKLASATAELAASGRDQLIKLIEIIEQISEEYKRIEQITTKINRIADKTHLLSLNAGLEAVRAGEHGLGFGFVAQQIGKLAEEASLSARDIGTLITSSSQSVTLSVNTAQQTRIAVEDIAKAAQESGSAVEFISSAITQQSASIEWISEQVSKIQSGGQENAAAAEEISATMLKLADVIRETHTQVQRFKLA